VVLPAYNAEATLSRTVAELDREVIDEVVLVDDASSDRTVELAHELGLKPICHDQNKGYGGNQKTCYRTALDLGADVIVMVHPDYQYSPLLVPAMASMIAYGEYDMVLGSRILAQNSVARGMPRYKYVANRILTFVENIALSEKLSEYHTGLRAFSSSLLGSLPFERNSDDFVFDNQIIAQAVAAGATIGEVSCPTRYAADSSSINLRRSIRYGLGVLRTCADYRLARHGLQHPEYLDFEPGKMTTLRSLADSADEDQGSVSEQSRKLLNMRNPLDLKAPAAREESGGRHHLTVGSLLLVLFAVAAAATGQLMLKHGMQLATDRARGSNGSLVIAAATTPWVLFGLVVFAVSAVAWLGALSRVPLNVAYPFNAVGYIVILAASVLILHERATVLTWAGSLLVVSGLIIVVFSVKS
jgi:multidrug transporter EmrE-like cation transporter